MSARDPATSSLLGTFALVALGPGAVMVAARTHAFGPVGVALAFGLVVTIVIASSGHLGGAHINPAVTIGFWSVRRFRSSDVLPYVIAQCVGAALASGIWRAHWLYWLAPILGMVLAMHLYDQLRPASARDSVPDVPIGVEGPI